MPTLDGAPSRRALLLRLVAGLALVVGYVDLIRGGITVAPLLLVTGYVVLVPLALLND